MAAESQGAVLFAPLKLCGICAMACIGVEVCLIAFGTDRVGIYQMRLQGVSGIQSISFVTRCAVDCASRTACLPPAYEIFH